MLAVLSGCTGAGPGSGGDIRSAGDTIRISPRDGAKDVGAAGRIEVDIPDGRLERVRVTRIEAAEREDRKSVV